jgi:hypothetical protein
VHAHVLDLEAQVAAGRGGGGDEVLDHLLLPVDGDGPAARQVAQRDAVAAAVEAQLDAVMDEALALEPLAQPGRPQQVHRALLEHAGAHAVKLGSRGAR